MEKTDKDIIAQLLNELRVACFWLRHVDGSNVCTIAQIELWQRLIEEIESK